MEKTFTSNSKERKVKCQLEQTEKHSSLETRLTFSRNAPHIITPTSRLRKGFVMKFKILFLLLFYFIF